MARRVCRHGEIAWRRPSSRLAEALGASLGLLALACAPRTDRPPATPEIVSFSADRTRVAPGERVLLSWETRGATELELQDGAGVVVFRAPSSAVAPVGDEPSSEASPGEGGLGVDGEGDDAVRSGSHWLTVSAETIFALRAAGPGGSAISIARVTVDASAPAGSLVAVPGRVAAGAPAQLRWSISGDAVPVIRSSAGDTYRPEGSMGALEVWPHRTTSYVLTAEARGRFGLGEAAATEAKAEAMVVVEPGIVRWSVEPPSVRPGEELTLSWETRGATRLELVEASLGLVAAADAPDGGLGELFAGSRRFVVPERLWAELDTGGRRVLRFALRALGEGAETVAAREALVSLGGGPVIERLEAPEAVTEKEKFPLRWRTVAAERVRVVIDGAVVFETQARELDRAREGELWLPAPEGPRRYQVEAVDAEGVRAVRSVRVRPVPPPRIDGFTLPGRVDEGGVAITARWQTHGASRLRLRLKGGPTVARVDAPRDIVAGRLKVRPGCTQTYVLEASNAAGATVSAERRVAVARPLARLEPWPAARGAPLSVAWNLSSLGVREVVGLPSPLSRVADSEAFLDLRGVPSARRLELTEAEDGVERVAAPEGFVFPFAGRLRSELWVAVDGFVAFEEPRRSGRAPGPQRVAGSAGVRSGARLAPFWDDLVLGADSSVHVALEPSSQPGQRRLTVQWSDLERAGEPGSALTFQAQLEESGLVRFVYGALEGGGASGDAATVGVWDVDLGLVQELPPAIEGEPRLRRGDELRFFGGAPPDGVLTLSSLAPRWLHFFGRTDDELVSFQLFVSAFRPGELVLSEAMPVTDAEFPDGSAQWVELHSRLDFDVDLGGLVLSSASGSERALTFDLGTVVPAGRFLLLGRTKDTERSAGISPDVLLDGLPPFEASDTLWLTASSGVVDVLSWRDAEAGASVQGGDRVLTSADHTVECRRTRAYGPLGYRGTPGAANERCAPYRVEQIASGFVELGDTGGGDTELLGSESRYSGKGTYALPRPFTYFGRSFPQVHVSVGGFLSFGGALDRGYETFDDPRPSPSPPNGVVAVFWDELYRQFPGQVWMRRAEDRTIVSWQDFAVFGTNARLSFQAHLLDTGVVELHYGPMVGSGDEDRVSGSSAAVWLESLDGTLAVPVSVHRPGGLSPHTSYRLTPEQ